MPGELVIDATGSGDCLTGASAWARSEGMSLELCVPLGLIAARLAVRSMKPVNDDLSSTELQPCFDFLNRKAPSSRL